MKQNNNNMSDFAEKIASSVDVTETEIIIKCGIPCIEDILRVHQKTTVVCRLFDVCDRTSAYINKFQIPVFNF